MSVSMRCAVLLAAVVSSAPGLSLAAPADEAKAAFEKGKAAFERGDYETALTEYQRANFLLPAPSLSYNIGTTYEHLGRFRDAALAFDRYLEQAGAPTSDEDKQFQDNLRARADADRKRADRAMPPAVTPPQPVYQPPPAYYYTPPPPMQQTREMKLDQAKKRRARAIALIAIGGVLNIAGIAVLIDGVLTPHSFDSCASVTVGGCLAGNTTKGVNNYVEDWFGATLIVVGITLWAPGAGSLAGAQKQIREFSAPEPAPPAATHAEATVTGAQPHAFLLNSPVFRF